ncbi:VanY-A/VanY-F/VanY-M family D-Ala-D-Ala carboxypeptidase [Metabacillus fastidiosus]|uniref:VanY-A/VanY-F/VanY-M family D-Ala-D-Ala carboxypeptidase n=1 Tax=Metabacillus fastidiosus TaxID=1458 RepID=UPI002E1AC964|nr:VanY-A/VanY-F/VanY-M family D-Ala-D-Ala carboxypeptidase [Metabacillus fastidiosus]
MKKWGFLLIIVLCISFVIIYKKPFFQETVDIRMYNQNNKDKLDYRETLENQQKIKITKEQIYKGNLLLVNREYPIREQGIKKDIVNLSNDNELTAGYGLLNNNIRLSKDIALSFSKMVADAEKEEVRYFLISSGYRDFDQQSRLYSEMGSDYALPAGYSEHNLGLSLDIGSTQEQMSKALEGKWVEKNAWKYGFILRYPKDKVSVTGIKYEPWHIRYVGLPHSAIMKEKNFALEEYLDYLKKEKSISVSIDGEKYMVLYSSVSQSTTIDVPENRYYEISGDNMNGVIVTVYE